MGELLDDVPSGIDLRDPDTARTWTREADAKRPWRELIREVIAATLSDEAPPVRRVLEIGSGPGLLAEHVLRECTVDRYTLFDFSQPMLDLSRQRLGKHPALNYVLGDFTKPSWTLRLQAPFDAVLAMQATHEIRHKRHLPRLYSDLHGVLRIGGLLLVSDHEPPDDSPRMTALLATEREQQAAMRTAGLADATRLMNVNGLYLCAARRAA